MSQPMQPYVEWKKENHLRLLEQCYEAYGPKFDEYEDFIEFQYAKASRAHKQEHESPSP